MLLFLVPPSLGDTAHHLHELLEIDLSVAVLVNLSNGLVQLLLRVNVAELFAGEQRQQLRRIDLPAVVRVKHLEGCLQVCLSQEGGRVHCRRDKFYNKQQEDASVVHN